MISASIHKVLQYASLETTYGGGRVGRVEELWTCDPFQYRHEFNLLVERVVKEGRERVAVL